jgi:pyruvate formate lyase activating enzyme
LTSGILFNIQQFSTEDGPGIRTTAFMKGCPLNCAWCHNPEGMQSKPDLVWYDTRCIAVKDCLRACPDDALDLSGSGMLINRQRCTMCGSCVKACPAAALEIIGKFWTPQDLLALLMKDAIFYETSGGGVTFSGGEPTQQIDFLVEVMALCKTNGLNIALDTCGASTWEKYERILPYIDLVLYDLKVMDSSSHLAATGSSNQRILENARQFAIRDMPMWIRTPVIPGYTATADNITAIGQFIHSELPNVRRWDLLAYTNLGKPKYKRLDRPYSLDSAPLLLKSEMESLHQLALQWVPSARWSGATR